MEIFGYKIVNKWLAGAGLIILFLALFIPMQYGKATKIFIGAIGFGLLGLGTGNKKFASEAKAIVIIIIVALSIKVTLLEAYIVPTGSMEETIMTGDFLIGSRFVYGLRTPDWIGIPYNDIGFFIPYIQLPKFKNP